MGEKDQSFCTLNQKCFLAADQEVKIKNCPLTGWPFGLRRKCVHSRKKAASGSVLKIKPNYFLLREGFGNNLKQTLEEIVIIEWKLNISSCRDPKQNRILSTDKIAFVQCPIL